MTNIEIKIKFWRDLWDEIIDNLLTGSSYELNLYTPHILIDDIISEIIENSFRNSENKQYFYLRLSNYVNNDPIIKEKINSQFKLLRKIFLSKRVNYILQISKDIKQLFQNGLYFDASLKHLIQLITIDEQISPEFINSINFYTQSLIVELIKKSYGLEDIKKFLHNIFDDYYIIQEFNLLQTDFPHGFEYEDYENDSKEVNYELFNNAVIQHISNLSIKDRIERLSYYYYKKKEEVYYIFIVEGLKGDIDIEIGDVTFYSLNKKRFIVDNSEVEDLQSNQTSGKFIQAAVKVEFLLPRSSYSEAIIKLENSLDLLTFYFKLKMNLQVNSSHYLVVNSKGNLISSSYKDNVFLKFNQSLNLCDIINDIKRLNKYSFIWNEANKKNKSITKLNNALNWYRKAEEALKQEDKILNYWISIENLFNLEPNIILDILNDPNKKKIHLIQETIASIQISLFIYNIGWDLYYHYKSIVNESASEIKLPEEIIKKAQLKPQVPEKIYLKNFIDNLDKIKIYEKDSFFIHKIDKIYSFYNNCNEAKKVIEQQLSQIKNDVLMIYRLRNLIVHNAYFDSTLLPYFVWKIKAFTKSLIGGLISNFDEQENLSNIILKIHLKREKLLQDMENGYGNLFTN